MGTSPPLSPPTAKHYFSNITLRWNPGNLRILKKIIFSKSIELESKTNIFSPWGLLHPCPSRGKNAILQTSILRGNSGNLTIREKIVFTCPNHLVFRGEKYDFSPGGLRPLDPR